jgi:hypothetical protein
MSRNRGATAAATLLALGAMTASGQTGQGRDAMPVSRLAQMTNARWVALSSRQRAVLHVQSTLTEATARLRLTVPGYEFAPIRKDGVDFVRVDVPGAGITPTVGRPELPVVRRFVAVPDGAQVVVAVKPGKPKILKNIHVYPVQEPPPEQEPLQPSQAEPGFAFSRDFYRLDQSYPANLATVSEPMKIRNVTVVMVEIAAMQYNGGKKLLSIFPDVQVDLAFSVPFTKESRVARPTTGGQFEAETGTQQALRAEKVSKNDVKLDAAKLPLGTAYLSVYDNLLVNWDWIKDHAFKPKWDYLIITPDGYYCEVQPLAQWKRDKGLSVHVTKLSEIGSAPTADQIRDYIKDAYDDHALEYVLLVGDTDMLPGYNYTGSSGTLTDYYYALVSGSDYLPDLAVGRFSGRTDTEISDLVAKTVSYEKTPTAGAWKSRALCISDSGYFQDTSDYNHDRMEAHGFAVDKIYAALGNATAANVSTAINDGRLLVSYRGHGSATAWSTSGFSNPDVGNLANGTLLPVIISPTCLTGYYDYSPSDCFSECWVKSTGGSAPRGAVAYWGSARVSYGGYNDELSKGSFDDFLGGDHVIGAVVNNAKLHMIDQYGLSDPTCLLELHLFNLFGDPELNVTPQACQSGTTRDVRCQVGGLTGTRHDVCVDGAWKLGQCTTKPPCKNGEDRWRPCPLGSGTGYQHEVCRNGEWVKVGGCLAHIP